MYSRSSVVKVSLTIVSFHKSVPKELPFTLAKWEPRELQANNGRVDLDRPIGQETTSDLENHKITTIKNKNHEQL